MNRGERGLFLTEEADSVSKKRRERDSLLYRDALSIKRRVFRFNAERRHSPSRCSRGSGSRSLLFIRGADSVFKKRRERRASIQRGGTLLLGAEEGVALVLFYSQRRRTPSLKRGESDLL